MRMNRRRVNNITGYKAKKRKNLVKAEHVQVGEKKGADRIRDEKK